MKYFLEVSLLYNKWGLVSVLENHVINFLWVTLLLQSQPQPTFVWIEWRRVRLLVVKFSVSVEIYL